MSSKKGSGSKSSGHVGDVIKQGGPKYIPAQGSDKYSPSKPTGGATEKAPKSSK